MSEDYPKKSTNKNTGRLVSARGAGEGVILRLDPDVTAELLIPELEAYIEERRDFLSGNQVSLDWQEGFPTNDLIAAVKECLEEQFSIVVKESPITESGDEHSLNSKLQVTGVSSFRPQRSSSLDEPEEDVMEASANDHLLTRTESSFSSGGGLLGGVSEVVDDYSDNRLERSSNTLSNSMFWDNPDAMIVHATLRSGQRIESENSIILIGDVNYGGEIISGGDVIVLGILRGVVHAGAYDENGGGRFIFSLNLQPTQLRIGSVISRGAESKSKKVPEIAYVDGNSIVVEQYNSRHAASLVR